MRRGNIKVAKTFTYHFLIREAISKMGQSTTHEIFSYACATYPNVFKVSNSSTWKNNIRQVLSKMVVFERDGKRWKYVDIEKIRENENKINKFME